MKLIRFLPGLRTKEEMLEMPVPIKKHVPEWYKNGESEMSGGRPGMKSCAPFLDVMLSGYALVTPFDIFVGKEEDGSLKIRWNGPDTWSGFVNERPKELGATMPRPAGHEPNHLVWASKWGWKTPRGWSTVVCHPFNRFDLPFTTTAGVVESDKFAANGNIPFFIKEGFTGVIPAGTPYAQILPFKRKSWKGIPDFGLFHVGVQQGAAVRKEGQSYKQKLWVRKTYN